MRSIALGVAAIIVSSSVALADDDARTKATREVEAAAANLAELRDRTDRHSEESLKDKKGACGETVAAARKAGVGKLASPAFDTLGGTKVGDKYEITIDRAAELCAEYARIYLVAFHHHLLEKTRSHLRVLDPQYAPAPDYVKGALADVAACRKAVDEMLAAKVPASFTVTLGGAGMAEATFTVGELKAKVCDATADAAAQFTKDMAEAGKKQSERFTKVGIAGDKLDLMIKYDGGLFLPGGASSSDMKKYAAASVLFVWLTSDPDDAGFVTHTVRRYQFKGNKLAKDSEKTYRKRKGDKLTGVFQ